MLFGGKLLTNLLVYHILYCLLLIDRIHCAYRVDAQERARRSVSKRDVPLERRQLHGNHVAIRDLLGLKENEHMEISEHIKTVQGSEVWRLHEKYLGLPVFGASLTVSTDETGHLTGDATGEFFQGIEQDIPNVTAHLSQSEVLDIALKLKGDQQFRNELSSTKCQLVVFIDDLFKAHLVYKLEYLLENERELERPTFIIDANTGEVLLNWENLDTRVRLVEGVGGNEKVGPIYYDKEHLKSYATQIGNTCFLENDHVKVIDMHNEVKDNHTDTASFSCDDGLNDQINGAYSPLLDAYYSANAVYTMFREWYDMPPLDKQIVFRVHFGVNFTNAFWDGDTCTFGDGGETFYPFISLDIAGHEVAHGVTERFSGLFYFDESGSINEAFSDMTAEAVEAFDHGTDWLIGADIIKEKEALRYFKDPSKDGVSLIHSEDFLGFTDPHYGSGIYNHVFYIIVQEKQLPIKEAYRVFLMANQMYWHQKTTFASGACDVMKAAYDLGKDLSIFSKAFEKVGIEVCDVSKHIIGLANNRTVTGVTVGPEVKPLFSFAYPFWIVNITINAVSNNGQVHINVTNGNSVYRLSSVLAEGTTNVIVKTVVADKIFIQLSPEQSKTISDVQLTASYSCIPEYWQMGSSEFYHWLTFCEESA